MAPPILNAALSAFARAARTMAGLVAGRILTLVSAFFESIVEARAMMAQRQAIRSAAGTASNERRHD